MSAVRPQEWEQLVECFPDCTVTGATDGSSLVSIPSVQVPAGWSEPTTSIWFLVPVGYPAAQPDCFWASHGLRLASGGMPANSGQQQLPALGIPVLWFSWHLATWRTSIDSLLTYTRFALRRFDDAR